MNIYADIIIIFFKTVSQCPRKTHFALRRRPFPAILKKEKTSNSSDRSLIRLHFSQSFILIKPSNTVRNDTLRATTVPPSTASSFSTRPTLSARLLLVVASRPTMKAAPARLGFIAPVPPSIGVTPRCKHFRKH